MMNRSRSIVVICVMTACGHAAADSAANDANAAQPVTNATQLVIAEQMRDPFWPPDYRPRSESEEPSIAVPILPVRPAPGPKPDKPAPAAKLEWPALDLQSIAFSGDKYRAMLEYDGKSYVVEQGMILAVIRRGVEFRFSVDSIGAKEVSITPIEAIPIRRQQ